ncbi:hypothetical protein C3943_21650 [Lysinibacillus sp. B2A1]|nr:hypothetical protein C3943_21650 [Lysinibacillus sp. B2A1]
MEIKTNEMEIVKKSFWKSKAFWIVSIIVFLISAYYIGKSNNVPKGIDSNFYNESVHAFEKYNEIFDDGKFPSNGFIPDDKDVKTWLATNTMNYSINPNDYTKKEARIIVLFNTIRENLKMLQQLGEGEGFKIQISEAWSELADILEIYSNSPLNNAAINQEESIVTEEATLDSTNADLENETNNFLDNNEDINTTNEFGITKLAKASGEGNITLVKNLLSQGADPNLCRDMGEPPYYGLFEQIMMK